MCGIIGAIATRPAAPILIEGLRRLEYRGYDSAGIAVVAAGQIHHRRAQGKLDNLVSALRREPVGGTTGIGHTRWATHGAAIERNAHPHGTGRVSVVHNGIIENHRELRAELEGEGQRFASDTDTEVIPQLVDFHLRRGLHPVDAADAAVRRLEGAYAIAMVFAGEPDLIVGARHGPPLAVGIGAEEMFVGSDAFALAPFARQVAFLEDGDRVVVDRKEVQFFDAAGRTVSRQMKPLSISVTERGKAHFQHYMEKELNEHPAAISNTLRRNIGSDRHVKLSANLPVGASELSRITISGCGSALYAGMVGRYWLESVSGVAGDVDVASELRYRRPPLRRDDLGLLISQSGETADTLAVLRYMREHGQRVVSVLNVSESSIGRESDAVLETAAGPEVSVASTKSFSAQLAALACIALYIGRERGAIGQSQERELVDALLEMPNHVASLLRHQDAIHAVAGEVAAARDVLYLGRGSCFPIALEGALKLKEISYLHAEGYAAGEMKHGSIAILDKDVRVIGVAPSGPLFEKTASNLQEAAARGADLIVFSDAAGAEKLRGIATRTVVLPGCHHFAAPVLYAVALQLLAYRVAVMLGRDVDQPRHLAKSVTVE